MRARTRRLSEVMAPSAPVPDLNDFARGDGLLFVRDGMGVAGRGEAVRVPIDTAPSFLASFDHDSSVEGAHPLAIGCLPPGSSGSIDPTERARFTLAGQARRTVPPPFIVR